MDIRVLAPSTAIALGVFTLLLTILMDTPGKLMIFGRTVLIASGMSIGIGALIYRMLAPKGRFDIGVTPWTIDVADIYLISVLIFASVLLTFFDRFLPIGPIAIEDAPVLLLTGMTLLYTYYRRNYLRALVNFSIGPETFRVNLVHVKDESIDIVRGDLQGSRGIRIFELEECGPKESLNLEEVTGIPIQKDEYELFLIGISYGGKVIFEPLHWWIHFWPPESFRILREEDIEEADLPGPEDRTLQKTDALLINDTENAEPTYEYDNLAYQSTDDKISFPLRRSSVRQQLDYYTSGHNVFIPIWVKTPAEYRYPSWLDDKPALQFHALRVVIDPPNLPVCIDKWIVLRLEDASPEELRESWT